VIFAKNENIFASYNLETRKRLINKLSGEMADTCSISYKIEEARYSNPGWELFNISLICRKK
jgi:hypothetical protein